MEMTFVFLVLCVFTFFLLLYIRGSLRFMYLVFKIRAPPLWDYVTVHAEKLLTDVLPHICEQCEYYRYRPWALWTMTLDYVVVVSNPEDIREMFQNKNMSTKPDFIYSAMADYLGEGSIPLRGGQKWRLHRKVVSPALHKATLEMNIDILSKGAENALKRLSEFSDGQTVDITHIIDEEYADTTVKFLGTNRIILPDVATFTRCLSDGLGQSHLKAINPVLYWYNQTFHKRTIQVEKKLRAVIEQCRTLVEKAVDDFSDEVNSRADEEPRDFFEAALRNISKAGGFDREELFDEFLTIATAAAETTKTAIKITILLLALHEEEQQRVAEELDGIFWGNEEPPTPNDLDKMQYLEMCIKESMRLFPPGPLLPRKVLKETNLNGTVIPEGAVIMACIMSLHRNPHVFENPMLFQPDRFVSDISQHWHPYSYLPFSGGMRNCIGKTQATMGMKIFLSSIFRHYRVLPGEGIKTLNDIKVRAHLTLGLRKCFVKLVPRK